MAQPKVQLVAPIGNINLPGMTATGVVTATSLSGIATGSVTNLTGSPDLDVGIVTGSSFVGDGTGHAASLTGTPNLNLGVTTATSFVGDAVGKAAGLTGTPNLNVGLITATSFVGFVTGDVTGNVTGNITGNITGNVVGDVTGSLTGLASSIKPGTSIGVGVCTAIQYHGDGSVLTGVGSSAYIAQEITGSGDETIIDLSYGNLIYYKGGVATTVGFASTSPAEQLTFIRDTSSTFDAAYNVSYSTGAVDFDGNDRLILASDAVLSPNDQDFTFEVWLYPDAAWGGSFDSVYYNEPGGVGGFWLGAYQGDWVVRTGGTANHITIDPAPPVGEWTHVAVTRSGSTLRVFYNGVEKGSVSNSTNWLTGATYIGDDGGSSTYNGYMSNLRFIKGTAVYTTDFLPPSAALTNITNTKLLCCQSDSSTTTAAVAPGTITTNGDPSAGAATVSASGTNTLNNSTSITWPDRVKWNNDTTPTLFTNPRDSASQIFRFTTVDTGLNYNAWEEIKSDSQDLALFIWGDNTNGGLGQNQPDTTDCSSPTQISGTWKTLVNKSDAGATQSCGAINTDGELWLWGRNARYQLGLSDQTKRSSPTQLPGSWSSVKLANAAQGVKTDGTMWSWGYGNSNGAMAQNEGNVQRSSPKQVGTDTNWSHVGKSGSAYFLGIKTDDTLWICGKGSAGRLGLNNLTQRSSPTQLPGSWSQAFACSDYLGGLKTDGTLWSWGYNSYGGLGQNNTTNRSSPVQIPGTWSDTAGGYNAMGGVKTDGTLWTWGYNPKGNLGHNNRTNYSSPKQIPGTTWRSVDLGYEWTVATKTDGTMWTWGSNSYGKLGIDIAGYPYAGDRSSPTQLPGTTWGEQVSLGERVSVATKLA